MIDLLFNPTSVNGAVDEVRMGDNVFNKGNIISHPLETKFRKRSDCFSGGIFKQR